MDRLLQQLMLFVPQLLAAMFGVFPMNDFIHNFEFTPRRRMLLQRLPQPFFGLMQ